MVSADTDTPERPPTASALGDVVSAPILLIACDYDGTIAPHVDDPARALPQRESIVALRSLASLPDTHVAVISGRSLRDLAALSRLPPEVHLVGSHGSEFEPGFAQDLPDQVRSARRSVIQQLDEIASRTPGAIVERKPASVAFHYRQAAPAAAAAAVKEILDAAATQPGVTAKHGKMVIELSLVDTDKGAALTRIRQQIGAEGTLFIGDDLTDEDAFAVLAGPDVGVKVGSGPTTAGFRVPDTDSVARLLAEVFGRRRAWLEGDSAPPIERHTLLSDQRTVALLTPDSRVSWFCHPRADSPAVFAELLGGPTAGTFAIRPDPSRPPLSQRYVGETLVVETRWPGLRVTDYLDVAHGRVFEPPGRSDLIRVIEGDVRVVIEFSPRVDFGRVPTRLEVADENLLRVRGAGDSVQLLAPGVEWEILEDGPHEPRLQGLTSSQMSPWCSRCRWAWTGRLRGMRQRSTVVVRRSSTGAHGPPGSGCPRSRPAWSAAARSPSRRCAINPRERSLRPPRQASPKRSAAIAIGTTGTAGYATPRSPPMRCCGWAARAKHSASSTG